MTKVCYYPDEHRLEVKGHAGAAQAGQDIVCAAESALTFTLINAATDDPAYMAHVYICQKDAEIRVQCYPDPEHEPLCREMFRTVLHGYLALQEEYPENVQVIGGYDG